MMDYGSSSSSIRNEIARIDKAMLDHQGGCNACFQGIFCIEKHRLRIHKNRLLHELEEAMRYMMDCQSCTVQHPPTAWGHLQPRTMGDPCPVCGGTDYYCAAMMDRLLSKDAKDFDAVMQALSELYIEYCEAQQKEPGKGMVQYHLHKLLAAYNRWLG